MWPVTIFMALVFSSANGLRTCDDCKKIIECSPAMELIANEKSQAIFNYAKCGTDDEDKVKVCCSELTSIRDIVNHRNAHLLPSKCGETENDTYHPWIVRISMGDDRRSTFICVGSLINSNYVLTTASCIKYVKIRLVRICYDSECKTNHMDIPVIQKSTHEGFFSVRRTLINDIGLLRLKTPFYLSSENITAICLPTSINRWDVNLTGAMATASGWGGRKIMYSATNFHSFHKIVPVYSHEKCEMTFTRQTIKTYVLRLQNSSYVKENKTRLCAGGISPESCWGDAGTALMVESSYNGKKQYVQYGVLSSGLFPSCEPDIPQFYTDVRTHMKWILDTIEE